MLVLVPRELSSCGDTHNPELSCYCVQLQTPTNLYCHLPAVIQNIPSTTFPCVRMSPDPCCCHALQIGQAAVGAVLFPPLCLPPIMPANILCSLKLRCIDMYY